MSGRYFLQRLGRRLRYRGYRIRGIQRCSWMGLLPICSSGQLPFHDAQRSAYLLGKLDSLIRVFVKVNESCGGLDGDGEV